MKSFSAFVFLLITGLSLATKRNHNKNLDNFLRGKAFVQEVRSLQVHKAIFPDFAVLFRPQFKVFGQVEGKAEFQNGKLTGLDRARRLSNCVFREKSEFPGRPQSRSKKTISCGVGFDELTVKYGGKLKLGILPKKNIEAEAKVSDVRFNLEMELGRNPVLKKFAFAKEGTAKVELSGLGIFKWLKRLHKPVEAGYNKHVLATMLKGMAGKLKNVINRALRKDSRGFRLRN